MRGEGVGTHLLHASHVLRIGKRRDEKLLELEVEIEFVRLRWAGDDEIPARLPEGGSPFFERHVVGLDLCSEVGDHLARVAERVDLLVERSEHLVVVLHLPARKLSGKGLGVRIGDLLGLRELALRFQHLLLQPAPQHVGVDVAVDGHALGPERRAGELVGAGRHLDDRAVHKLVELVDRGADVGEALRIAGRLRKHGHPLQLVADGHGGRGRIVQYVVE